MVENFFLRVFFLLEREKTLSGKKRLKKGVTRYYSFRIIIIIIINMVAAIGSSTSKLADKLKQRWTQTGSGPDVQKKLDAIKETLKAREQLKRLEKKKTGKTKNSNDMEGEKYAEKVRKEAKLDETDASLLDMEKALPEAALEVARQKPRDESEIVSQEDIDAENASNQLVDVFEKRKRVTPDVLLKELKSEHPANAVREKANDLMRASDLKMAVAMYDEALSQCEADLRRKRKEEEEEERSDENEKSDTNAGLSEEELIAVVTLCNRSKAKLKDGEDLFGALEDAINATTIAPDWSKARFRCGEAYAALSAWSFAVASLRVGEKLASCEKGSSTQPFKDFLDVVAIKAAKNGSPAGFDGRLIYVRSAGEEAWLGKEAPTNAEFDVTDEHKNPINTERYGKEDGYMAEARRKAETNKNTALHARSIREAVELAEDGDKILLLRGIHNGCGETVCVTKRVWIKGEGELKEATIDMRANSPTFRITRTSVVSNVDFDFSGFAESVRVAQMERGNILNTNQFETLMEGCSFTCTGCDGVVVSDKAKATFRNCNITGKNNCARLSRDADATFIDCKIHGGDRAGVYVTDNATCTLRNCVVENTKEEAVVVTQNAECTILSNTILRECKGPGVDCSNNARCLLSSSQVTNNVGGIWAWDSSSVTCVKSLIDGGQSHALVFDGHSSPTFSDSVVVGVALASEKSWKGIRGPNVTVAKTEQMTSWPSEDGCFKFSPNAFTRKQ